ncbi:MAG: hypothetical protein NTZ09_21780 [Candidatus Hydrogenedentes bacterium]|nr:hypothetical protein [Candidatus Hydrogenedentota bacterium]
MRSLLRTARATQELAEFPAPKVLSLREWKERVRINIRDNRLMLEHWLGELDKCVNGGRDFDSQEEQDKATCECTRMVRFAGQTLHSNTEIYRIETKEPHVEAEWDLELARRTDALLQKAKEIVVTDTDELRCRSNCRERAGFAREQWSQWCPDYARELESQGIRTQSQEAVDK